MKCYNEFLYEVNIFYSYQLVCFYNLIWGWGLHSAAQNGGLANSSWQVEPVEGAHGPGGLGVGQGRGGRGVGNILGGHSDCFLCFNAAVCDIYVVKLLFRDTLPRYTYT